MDYEGGDCQSCGDPHYLEELGPPNYLRYLESMSQFNLEIMLG